MTVSILGLTDTDEIRAAIGSDDKDLSDTAITNFNPKNDLRADLLIWVPTYQTIISEGAVEVPTTDQELKLLQLKLYAKYFTSWLVASSAQNSLVQKVSDGSNEMSRFTNVKMTDLIDRLEARANGIRTSLEKLITPESSSSFSQFGTAAPAVDQVTLGVES